jgi:hypothetical protein
MTNHDSLPFPAPKREIVHYAHRETDQIVVFDGNVYRDQMAGPDGDPLPAFNPDEYVIVGRLRHHAAVPGHYPWDHWETRAKNAGVDEDLAELGRALIREADQHSWDEDLQSECGWSDNGDAMLELALNSPQKAQERWELLLRTDGYRVSDNGPQPS